MIWAVTFGTFLATVAVCLSLYFAFTPSDPEIARRLTDLAETQGATVNESFGEKQMDRLRELLIWVGTLFPGSGANASRATTMMNRAGFRGPTASVIVRGLKVLLPVVLVGAVLFTGIYRSNPFVILGGALLAGIVLPEAFILWRVSARQHRLRKGLPDALDLLVICVEAGLGIDQALMRVSEELKVVHRDLSEELQLVNLEMRVGKTRIDALRELARRTGVQDIKALVAMLAQTERFGTSIAQSLRVYSDDLRVRRRQRAEEMAAKTTVKMVPPLVLFIFPALMVVILGPAILILIRQFINVF
jgi:tight adherence protein C